MRGRPHYRGGAVSMIGSPMSHLNGRLMAQAGRLGKRSASDQPSAWKPASRRACTELKPCSSPPFSEDLRAKMRTDEVAGARNFGNLSREYPETGTLWRNG